MSERVGFLLISGPDGAAQAHVLFAGAAVIGREPDCGYVLSGQEVARQHAEIEAAADGVVLISLGHEHSTRVSGQAITPQVPRWLNEGEPFEIGRYRLSWWREAPESRPSVRQEREFATWEGAAASPESARTPAALADLPDASGRYMYDLPAIYHGDELGFLARYLRIFEHIWEPLEHRQDWIAMYVHPRTCPERFLPWIAAWVGLSIPPYVPAARTRALVAEAFTLGRWQGTSYGLQRLCELCAGAAVTVETQHDERSSTIVVRAAPDTSDETLGVIQMTVRAQKPVHLPHRLERRQ